MYCRRRDKALAPCAGGRWTAGCRPSRFAGRATDRARQRWRLPSARSASAYRAPDLPIPPPARASPPAGPGRAMPLPWDAARSPGRAAGGNGGLAVRRSPARSAAGRRPGWNEWSAAPAGAPRLTAAASATLAAYFDGWPRLAARRHLFATAVAGPDDRNNVRFRSIAPRPNERPGLLWLLVLEGKTR